MWRTARASTPFPRPTKGVSVRRRTPSRRWRLCGVQTKSGLRRLEHPLVQEEDLSQTADHCVDNEPVLAKGGGDNPLAPPLPAPHGHRNALSSENDESQGRSSRVRDLRVHESHCRDVHAVEHCPRRHNPAENSTRGEKVHSVAVLAEVSLDHHWQSRKISRGGLGEKESAFPSRNGGRAATSSPAVKLLVFRPGGLEVEVVGGGGGCWIGSLCILRKRGSVGRAAEAGEGAGGWGLLLTEKPANDCDRAFVGRWNVGQLPCKASMTYTASTTSKASSTPSSPSWTASWSASSRKYRHGPAAPRRNWRFGGESFGIISPSSSPNSPSSLRCQGGKLVRSRRLVSSWLVPRHYGEKGPLWFCFLSSASSVIAPLPREQQSVSILLLICCLSFVL